MIDFTRKEPKLNSIYNITKKDSEESINCRINFNIIDFMYLSLVKKCNRNKTDYYYKLYEFLDIGESYYERLRNGNKIDKIKHSKRTKYTNINELITGKQILTIDGISIKQWKKYFSILKKIKELKKVNAERTYINEAECRRDRFQQVIFDKIYNKEMSMDACKIYESMSQFLFEDEILKVYSNKADKWLKVLGEISITDIEGLRMADRQKFKELQKVLYDNFKRMENIRQQSLGKK